MNLEEPDVAAMPQPLANDLPAEALAEARAETRADARTDAPPRRRRPEPARTAPLRHAATLLRNTTPTAAAHAPVSPAAAAAAAASAASGASGAFGASAGTAAGAATAGESPVALGVRLGYQVIEEQILQGQKLAQRLGRKAARVVGAGPAAAPAAGSDAQAGAGEVGELVDRVVHLYKDLGALCVDAVEALARNPVLRAGVARLTPSAGAAATSAPAAAAAAAAAETAAPGVHGGGGYSLDIRCSRRTQVTLDLRGRSGSGAPRVHALHAADPALPPLTDVRFTVDAAQAEPVLQLVIADEQPASTYTGVVVDGHTNEPRGTLSVRLLP